NLEAGPRSYGLRSFGCSPANSWRFLATQSFVASSISEPSRAPSSRRFVFKFLFGVAVLSRLVRLEPEREADREQAGQDRVPTDDPHHGQRARIGSDHQDDAEGNRKQTVEGKSPFALDFVAQLDRAYDLHKADDDRPTGDEYQQD